MGAPAARVGDQTRHGTPLGPGPGAPTVLIGGMPSLTRSLWLIVHQDLAELARVKGSGALHPRGSGFGERTVQTGGLTWIGRNRRNRGAAARVRTVNLRSCKKVRYINGKRLQAASRHARSMSR